MSEGIDVNETNGSKECIIYLSLLYVPETNFRFQPKDCNGCHNLMQKGMKFNVAINVVKGNYCRFRFWLSKGKALKKGKKV